MWISGFLNIIAKHVIQEYMKREKLYHNALYLGICHFQHCLSANTIHVHIQLVIIVFYVINYVVYTNINTQFTK